MAKNTSFIEDLKITTDELKSAFLQNAKSKDDLNNIWRRHARFQSMPPLYDKHGTIFTDEIIDAFDLFELGERIKRFDFKFEIGFKGKTRVLGFDLVNSED